MNRIALWGLLEVSDLFDIELDATFDFGTIYNDDSIRDNLGSTVYETITGNITDFSTPNIPSDPNAGAGRQTVVAPSSGNDNLSIPISGQSVPPPMTVDQTDDSKNINNHRSSLMKVIKLICILVLLSLSSSLHSDEYTKSNYIDPDIESRIIVSSNGGFVPNKEIAIKIAETILSYFYGEKIIKNRPFIAKLTDGGTVWYITGTFPESDKAGYFGGGVPHIKIAKDDGRIIGFIHGK